MVDVVVVAAVTFGLLGPPVEDGAVTAGEGGRVVATAVVAVVVVVAYEREAVVVRSVVVSTLFSGRAQEANKAAPRTTSATGRAVMRYPRCYSVGQLLSWMTENIAPCGSWMTVMSPAGVGAGPIITVPPNSVARSPEACASAVPK